MEINVFMQNRNENANTRHGERPSNEKYRYVTGLHVNSLQNSDYFFFKTMKLNPFVYTSVHTTNSCICIITSYNKLKD